MFKFPIKAPEKFACFLPHIASFMLMIVPFTESYAQTYRWVDEQGVTHFSQQAPDHIEQAETIKANHSIHHKKESTKADLLIEREEYQNQRQALQKQIEGTTSVERREQLNRQLQQLDLSWYQKYDPEKAAELEKLMAAPKVRELPAEKPVNNMDRYKAFY